MSERTENWLSLILLAGILAAIGYLSVAVSPWQGLALYSTLTLVLRVNRPYVSTSSIYGGALTGLRVVLQVLL